MGMWIRQDWLGQSDAHMGLIIVFRLLLQVLNSSLKKREGEWGQKSK